MKIKAFLLVLVLLVLLTSVGFAAKAEIEELYILLKPSSFAVIICDDHQTPEVQNLRTSGVRVTCPDSSFTK